MKQIKRINENQLRNIILKEVQRFYMDNNGKVTNPTETMGDYPEDTRQGFEGLKDEAVEEIQMAGEYADFEQWKSCVDDDEDEQDVINAWNAACDKCGREDIKVESGLAESCQRKRINEEEERKFTDEEMERLMDLLTREPDPQKYSMFKSVVDNNTGFKNYLIRTAVLPVLQEDGLEVNDETIEEHLEYLYEGWAMDNPEGFADTMEEYEKSKTMNESKLNRIIAEATRKVLKEKLGK